MLRYTVSGSLANGMGASITGLSTGVAIGGSGMVANDGMIAGGVSFGVELGSYAQLKEAVAFLNGFVAYLT